MRRGLLIGGAAVAGLVAVYAAAGYWLAPGFLHARLVDAARQAGLDLRIEKVSTHPFALAVELHDVGLSTLEGKRLLYVQRALADLSAASLFHRRWIAQKVALEEPVLTALPVAAGKGGGGPLPRLEVREVSVADGVLSLPGLPRVENVAITAESLSTLGEAGKYQASATLAEGGRLSSEGRLSLAPLDAQGAIRLERGALKVAWRFLPDRFGAAPAGAIDGSLGYRFHDGHLSVQDFRASARSEAGATLAASGAIGVQPFSANLALDGERLPLTLLQPLLPEGASLAVVAGALSGKGRLHLGGERPRYEGSLTLHDARIDDGAGRLLLAWQRLSSERVGVQFSPFGLHADEIVASAPHGRIAIDAQGRLNFMQLFAGAGGKGAGGARPEIGIARVVVQDGRVDFSDRSLPSPFATTVRELAGTVSGLSTTTSRAARVQLDGRVGKYGDARVRGTVDLTAPSELTNLRARFRNLALPDFTPYAVKFAGYRIEDGRLDAELHYRVNQGRLVGTNQLVFEDLKLGEKVESASALDLPIELAVALLTDSQGRINLAIPVSGNLKDPHFDIGGLVAKALGNTLRKVASAPFRLLASIFGHGGEAVPEAVNFDPGSAQVAPPEEETAATLARALAERPQLELAIHAGYDAETDAAALKRAQLLRQLAARAGRTRAAAGGSAAANAGDPKIVAAAEALLRSQGVDLAALEPKKPGYGRRLVERLAASAALEPYALQQLAQDRARAVQQALVKHGAPADRVTIDSARETKADEAGVPTSFELRPHT